MVTFYDTSAGRWEKSWLGVAGSASRRERQWTAVGDTVSIRDRVPAQHLSMATPAHTEDGEAATVLTKELWLTLSTLPGHNHSFLF